MLNTGYCGIDVAFAKRKTLPIAICIRDGSRLRPLQLRDKGLPRPPRGFGNRATLNDDTVAQFAADAATYLREIERRFDITIATVAIDAPRDYAEENQRRECEKAMDAAGLSCFATPSRSRFAEIRQRARQHLADGGSESRIPHSNQLWMLVGFALFRQLEQEFDCIEVFPNAIVRTIERSIPHKFTSEGIARQIQLLTDRTGILASELESACYGPRHDRVDALLGAWVASVDATERVAFGDRARDTIWTVPPTHNA